MEDFTIFIVLGLYWLFSAMRNSSKKQGSGERAQKSVTGSLADRIREAQRAAGEKLAAWEEEQRQLEAAKKQSAAEEPVPMPVLSRAEPPARVRREARAAEPRPVDPIVSHRSDTVRDPMREMQRRLAVEKARRAAAERDRDEALTWIRRLEEGVATASGAALSAGSPPAEAPATPRPRQPAKPAVVERRELPGLTRALERLPPLRRAILYAEITGAPASLRPDVGGLGRAEF
ncbi:MAG: hypothetical protein ABFS14_03965 [Gemmatimonadota bacterium]